jgi:hypothetical protein
MLRNTRRRYAYDSAEDHPLVGFVRAALDKLREPLDADVASQVLDLLAMKLSPDDQSELLEDLGDRVDAGDCVAGDRRGRDRRVARDDPPPFEGRPRPGGGMDPDEPRRGNVLEELAEKTAADRRRRASDGRRRMAAHDHALAADAALQRRGLGFFDIFPEAAAGRR